MTKAKDIEINYPVWLELYNVQYYLAAQHAKSSENTAFFADYDKPAETLPFSKSLRKDCVKHETSETKSQ